MNITTTNYGYSKFSADSAIELIKHIKPIITNHYLDKILAAGIDRDLFDNDENNVVQIANKDKYGWIGPLVFQIGKENLFMQFDGYFCYKIGLNTHPITKVNNIENIPLKNITSPTKETYFDISFLYTEVIAHKITDIYTHKTADGSCLLAIIMVMDNQHYIAVGNDIDNPRMAIFTTLSAMEQALQQWEQEA